MVGAGVAGADIVRGVGRVDQSGDGDVGGNRGDHHRCGHGVPHRVIRIAAAIPSREVRREATISGMIELAVRHRRTTALVHTDPAVAELVEAVGEFRDAVHSLQVILAGPAPDPASRTAVAVLVSGIFGAAADPAVADILDEELHRLLLDCSRRLFAA